MSQLVSLLLALPAIRPVAALLGRRGGRAAMAGRWGQRHDHACLHPLQRARRPHLGGERVGARVRSRAAYEQVLTPMSRAGQTGLVIAFLIGVLLVIIRRSGSVVRQQATQGWSES